MPTRNVVLTDDHEALIQSLVASGRYQNASQVIREGLRLIGRREAEAKLEPLRAAATTGLAAIAAGNYNEFLERRSLQRYLSDISGVGSRRTPDLPV